MHAGRARRRRYVRTGVAAEMENLQILVHNDARMLIAAPDNAVCFSLQVRRRWGRFYGFAGLPGSIIAATRPELGIVFPPSLPIKPTLLVYQCEQVREGVETLRFA